MKINNPGVRASARMACLTILVSLVTTTLAEDTAITPEGLVQQIEAAHRGEAFAAKQAVQTDYAITFGDRFQTSGTMTFTPSMSQVRLDLKSGVTVVYDGETVWQSPADAETNGPSTRFHVFTWPYFMAAPYKLDDPGTKHELVGSLPMTDAGLRRGVKVTFEAGTGDTPDDWYIAFDGANGKLDALAYIVTFGTAEEKANEDPGIILYSDFVEVDSIPFATTWTFHHWSPETGLGEKKGTGTLKNIRFVTRDAEIFAKPKDAAESTMPGK